jgi:prophage tail gpP-like protein
VADEFRLFIAGVPFGGWKSGNVTKRLDSIAGAFSLTLDDVWTGKFPGGLPIRPGLPVVVTAAGDGPDELLISGYIDAVDVAFGPGEHRVEVKGRDRAADLVDCSHDTPVDEYREITLLSLATLLCTPFGITVTSETPEGGVLPRIVKLEPGAAVFETLERYGRMAGKLFVSKGPTGIVMTLPGIEPAVGALTEGENIQSASMNVDFSNRFSKYVVKGQMASDDSWNGLAANQPFGTAVDANVLRYRPKIVVSEAAIDLTLATARASWEATVAAGRSVQMQVTVPGWRQIPKGPLWAVNQVVQVNAPKLGVTGPMLVTGVNLVCTESEGGVTQLELAPVDAYKPEPFVPPFLFNFNEKFDTE